MKDYTLNGKIPVFDHYLNGMTTNSQQKKFTTVEYNSVFEKLKDGTFEYYGDTLKWLLEALTKYDVQNKSVCVFGATGINCDAIALSKGASEIIILEYNKIESEHPRVKCFDYTTCIKTNIKCDFGISISSFEHDGLGRYGDPLNPNGDLKAMHTAKSFIKPNGLLFLSVPVASDALFFNAHRVYGELRLPMLFKEWKMIDSYGFSQEYFKLPRGSYNCEPVFVLKNI